MTTDSSANTPKFAVGQRVRVKFDYFNEGYVGLIGTVDYVFPNAARRYVVLFSGDLSLSIDEEYLELVAIDAPPASKPTMITAAEWPTVADAVARGQCEVEFLLNRVVEVSLTQSDGWLEIELYNIINKTTKVLAKSYEIFTVRWLTDNPPGGTSGPPYTKGSASIMGWMNYCRLIETGDTPSPTPAGGQVDDAPYSERIESWMDENDFGHNLQALRDTEDKEQFIIRFIRDTTAAQIDQIIAALRADKFGVDDGMPTRDGVRVSVPNAWIPQQGDALEVANQLIDQMRLDEQRLRAERDDLKRQLDRETSRVRVAQAARDNETERYAQAYENYIKLALFINRFAADNPELKQAWEKLQLKLHKFVNEHDKVAARVSMLASENAALTAVNGRLERQLAASEERLESIKKIAYYPGTDVNIQPSIYLIRNVFESEATPAPAVDGDLRAAVQPFVEFLRLRAAEENETVFAQAGGKSSVSLTIGDLRKLRDAAAALKAAGE